MKPIFSVGERVSYLTVRDEHAILTEIVKINKNHFTSSSFTTDKHRYVIKSVYDPNWINHVSDYWIKKINVNSEHQNIKKIIDGEA